jgi:CheY-like chemotaxis protein
VCTSYYRIGSFTVSVADSGAGISVHDQAKVFNEIVQFSPNELQAGGGSGLGLWISKRICDLHGSRIEMFSAGEGSGSTFIVKVPLYRPTPGPAPAPSPSPDAQSETSLSGCKRTFDHYSENSLSSELTIAEENKELASKDYGSAASVLLPLSPIVPFKQLNSDSIPAGLDLSHEFRDLNILIVDDAKMIVKVVSRLLAAKGAKCTTAEDGAEAMKLVEERLSRHLSAMHIAQDDGLPVHHTCATGHFDAILMDFVMPVCDGPTATKKLREEGYDGLIIGVTGNMMPFDIHAFKAAGANTVLGKPLDVNELAGYFYKYRTRTKTNKERNRMREQSF